MSKTKLQTKWDLSPLLKGDSDPQIQKKLKKVKVENYKFINKWKNRDDYLKDPRVLRKALDEYEHLFANYGTDGAVGYYFWLRTHLEQENTNLKAKFNKISDESLKIYNDLQFFGLNLAKIPQSEQKKFLQHKELKDYKHFLEGLFKTAKYQLSEKEEKILNLTSAASYDNWVKMVSTFISKEEAIVLDDKGRKATKSFSEILSLTSNTKKKVRDKAAQAINEILEKHVDVAEHEVNSILHDKKITDELRGLERPDLARHLQDDIDSAVVDSLVKAVSKRGDISKDYYKLKASLFGVEKLNYHERNVPYASLSVKYSFEKSVSLVRSAFEKLDPLFSQFLDNMLEKGRIDVFPKKGKGSGAFCAYGLKTHPVYILMNHTNELEDVRTFAHEMGHAINDILMQQKQNALNAHTPLATAEVASTFMEDFVLQELAQGMDDETRLALLMKKLNADVSSIHRQIGCYLFEQDLHKGYREKGYLSKEYIGKLFTKNMKAYMGPYVKQSKGSENWWVYWSHVRSYFYVYSYASGLLISKALQNNVKTDPKFIKEIKTFLSAGASKSPKELFLDLGIDITNESFWDVGLDEVENTLKEAKKLARKLGKI